MLLWFLPLFLLLIMIGLPVVFGLLAAPVALIMLEGDGRNVVAGLYRNLYNGMDSFPLMALPFFMLAGEVMNRGGITLRLVEFSQAFMGHMRGGLAHVIDAVRGPFWVCGGRYIGAWVDPDPRDGKKWLHT